MLPTLSDPFAGQGQLIYNEYELHLDLMIGKGAFGTVFACTRIKDQQKTEICVKIVKKSPHLEQSLQKEIQIVNKIGEKKIQVSNLVKTYEIYQEPQNNYIYFFMEKCDTTLDKYMNERFNKGERFSSEEIQNLISQLATGYKSLTAMEIIHRDLKPENILVTMKQSGPLFKISDYGAGTIVAGGKQAVTNAGSPFYQAPEILLQDSNGPRVAYTNKCDIYSLGIIIYIFSYGTQHVQLQSMAQLRSFLNSLKTKPFQCPENSNVPQEVKELIEKMIVFDENKRISWADLQKFKLFENIKTQQQPITQSPIQPQTQAPAMKIIINKYPQVNQQTPIVIQQQVQQQQQLTKPQGGKVIYNDYEINFDAMIGKGQTGRVYECLRMKTNTKICVKVIQRTGQNAKSLENEINIINQINSVNIRPAYLVQVFEIYEEPSRQYVYIFMERANGTLTETMNRLFDNGQRFQQEQLVDIFCQIAFGYNFLYKRNIVHRDLKSDNILVVVNSANKQLFKISDYGCGKTQDKNTQLVTGAGTKFYMAPEILNQQGVPYDNKCDVYSLGILFHQLCYPKVLDGRIKTPQQLYEFHYSLRSGFKCPLDQFVPPEITQLLERMIVLEPNQRISWDQAYDQIQSLQSIQAQRAQSTPQINFMNQAMNQNPNNIRINNQQRFETNPYPNK